MTPVRYLQMLRLNAARQLLESGQQSVTNVAYDCGFSSSQYFATCYKKRFGFSPIETPRQQTMMTS
ncbi:HTH-type transcriptional activator RhaS [compost metagenome]